MTLLLDTSAVLDYCFANLSLAFLRFRDMLFCMVQVISIRAKGSMVLPEAIRRRLGLISEGERVELSEVEGGVMIRRFDELEAEVYTDERMVEFEENNEKALESFKEKIKNALH
jgi:AbrB family looped-hinge helix DNA binding protein